MDFEHVGHLFERSSVVIRLSFGSLNHRIPLLNTQPILLIHGALETCGGTHDLASKIVVACLIYERSQRKREIDDENAFANLGFAATKTFVRRRQIPSFLCSPLIRKARHKQFTAEAARLEYGQAHVQVPTMPNCAR